MGIQLRPPDPSDVSDVIELLADASAWLRSLGIDQWPTRFSESFISATVERGELHVATEAGEVVGTITLQWSDPMFWGDRSDAGFFHRLAVRRSHAGLGRRLIDWADLQAQARGRPYLCLDAMTSNRRLRNYYHALGFEEVAQIEGPPEHPHSTAHGRWQATLYQRPVGQFREPLPAGIVTTG